MDARAEHVRRARRAGAAAPGRRWATRAATDRRAAVLARIDSAGCAALSLARFSTRRRDGHAILWLRDRLRARSVGLRAALVADLPAARRAHLAPTRVRRRARL